MTGPNDFAPRWEERVFDGVVQFASAEIDLPHPIDLPPDTPTCLFLHVYRDGDDCRWSCYYKVPEEAPFNEGEIKWGWAADMEQAKRDSWTTVYQFLVELDYTDDDISSVVPVPAGSLQLDLAEDDDDDE
jgi:hypothetical protein